MEIFSFLSSVTRRSAFLIAGSAIAAIALVDWRAAADIPLGFLYLFPMLLVGSVFGRIQIAGVAVLCTVLAEYFDEFPWGINTGIPRDVLYFSAFFCVGLFMHETMRLRRLSADYTHRLEREMDARRDAEEQLKVLVESSPAAILTTDSNGRILLANDAAHRLFGAGSGSLPGLSVRDYLPSLVNVPALGLGQHSFRTAMECQGRRPDGEVFQADVWFSTYLTSAGPRLAAMVLDTSEDLRTREESSLRQLLVGSRILVSAVSHEIRNICGAIALVCENLTRSGELAGNKDFEALGTLVLGLERIAAMDLQQAASQAASLDIRGLLDELRIVIEPSLQDAGIKTNWQVDMDLPPVWADRQSLMQVFLNLTKNSERAMSGRNRRELTIAARRGASGVVLRFADTGSGVTHPERLFHPFQKEAQSTGLGLYLSRAFMRNFHGDLRYEPQREGAVFVVELSAAVRESENEENEQPDTNFASGRPQSLSREPEQASSDRN